MRSSEKEFIAESEEILEDAGSALLNIQDSIPDEADPALVNQLFRAMHTLKGMSGLFGYQEVTDISHALENLLDDVRLGKVEMSDEVVAFLFKFIDILRSLIEGLKSRKTRKPPDISGHLSDIQSFRKAISSKAPQVELDGLIDKDLIKVLSEYEEHRLKKNIAEGRGIYMVKTMFSLTDFDVKLKKLTTGMRERGEVVSTMPTSDSVAEGSIGFNLIFCSSVGKNELEKALGFKVEELVGPAAAPALKKEELVGPAAAPALKKEEPVARAVSSSLKSSSTTVRVDIEKIDRILNTIGEIGMAKSTIERIWASLVESYGHTPNVIELYRVGQSLQRRLAELQEQVLEVRMVPIGQIFSRLAQVVRRYSRKVGKEIDLRVFGEDTEIDKYLAEEIIDPLVHLVRNSIDHGIEHADVRAAAGKDRAGGIRLRAYQHGNSVIVKVEDDGRGIDFKKVRKKAEALGLLSRGDDLSEKEILDLIFEPGLSTSDSVSEVSGRGVGLDIVYEKLSSLGGVVDVSSEDGVSTTFVLTLPITLAILRALVVRVDDQHFAVPLSAMSETLAIEHRLIGSIENRKVYNLRGQMLPLASLRDFLGFPQTTEERSFAIVAGSSERKMGLLVDELFGQQDIIIKSLGGYFEGLKGFAGATVAGEDDVILVLDPEAVIEDFSETKGNVHV